MTDSLFAKLKGFFLAILSFSSVNVSAQLAQGRVYRFTNVAYTDRTLCAGSTTTVAAGVTPENSKTQLWYVDTQVDGSDVTTYRLRNLRTGGYMKGAGQSAQWTLTDEGQYFYLLQPATGEYTLSTDNSNSGRNKMHCSESQGYNVVGWGTDARATQWTITEVTEVNGEPITEAWLTANWAEVSDFPPSDATIEGYQAALNAIFTDQACTTLSDTYASKTESALEADANYTALPSALRAMVKKIWKENNGTAVTEAWKEGHVTGDAALEWRGDYAKRFRVQLYEPYTERNCTNRALKINPHTNLNNPTGIIANEGDLLFIMVEGEIKAGASLYLGSYEGHGQAGNYNEGVQLKQGLNVVPYMRDRQWTCIYYTVQTLKEWDGTTNKTQYDLTQFPDLKIHIEGGNVNGFYNAVGDDLWAHDAATTGCDAGKNVTSIATTLNKPNGGTTTDNPNLMQTNCVYPKGDNEADWDYVAARNVLPDLTILGRYMVFQFYFESPEPENPQFSTGYWFTKPADGERRMRIPEWVERWDRVMLSERLTMGLLGREEMEEANARFHAQDATKHDIYTYTGDDASADFGCDYGKHYRIHGLAISNNSGYMSGGWNSSNYHYNTLGDIIGGMLDTESTGGVTWGPGHEIGHQHQGPFNMRGLTEVTNNLYSNIAVWYDGRGTSRVNGGEGDLTSVLQAYNQTPHDFFTNNIWAQTHMYYKLWLYYHLVGKNTKFYPRLMEMLRRDPMTIEYNQQGNTSLLHFYKKVCDAAGEDLTEFFRAYGFLEVMTDRFVGDYSSAIYNQTQADIDAAIAYVKGKNYPKNTDVLFINDYTSGATYLNHEGEPRKLWDGTTYSDLGSYTVLDGTDAAPITGDYSLTVSNGQVNLGGATGGMGFLIYDENGKLLGFSSDKTFPVSDELEKALAAGTATVKAMPADGGDPVEVTYDGESASVSLLEGILAAVDTELKKPADDGGESGEAYTHVGYYKSNKDTYVALVKTFEAAKEIYKRGEVDEYVPTYTALRQAYEALLADEFATVPLVSGNKYYIRSAAKKDHYMHVTSENKMATAEALPADAATAMWVLEPAGTDGKYYLKNTSADGLYVQNVENANGLQFTCGATKYAFTLTAYSVGRYNFYSEDAKRYMNAGGASVAIISWGGNDGNSLWTIELAEADALAAGVSELQRLATQTKALMDEMATVKVKGQQDMSLVRISSNTPENAHGTEMLIDGNPETYFHTNWQGTPVSEHHHLLIDFVSADDAIDLFTLNWQTLPQSSWNVDAPKTVIVEGTNTTADGLPTDFTEITTLAWDDATHPLPIDKAQAYVSGDLGTAGTAYRYIRLRVTAATGGNLGGYPYFGLAELGLTRANSKVIAVDEQYGVGADEIHDIANAIGDALNTTFTDANEVATLTAQMKTYYATLQQAHYNVHNAALDAAREELRTWVEKTQALMDRCGTVAKVSPEVTLQSTNADAAGYLWCNAPYTAQNNNDYSAQGTDGYHLLDGNINTYLHTDYSGAIAAPHYLRVYAGEEGIGQFAFSYTNRAENTGAGNPTEIVVEGSDEADGTYTTIATLTKDNPFNPMPINSADSQAGTYTSAVLGSKTKTYRYLRFRVSKTNGSNGWFYMSEFRLLGVPAYRAAVAVDNAALTPELLIATEQARSAAAAAMGLATTQEELAAAKQALTQAYDKLHAAARSADALQQAIAAVRTVYTEAETMNAANPTSLNLTEAVLEKAQSEISEAQGVHDNADASTDEAILAAFELLKRTTQNLQTAMAYVGLSVQLTADAAHPVLYSIIINRDNQPVFQSRTAADGSENKIKLSAYEAGNERQQWFFMAGSEAPKVRILCKATPNLVMACTPGDFGEGAGKIQSLAPEAACGTNEWTISSEGSNAGWYNLTALNGSTTFYMSNHGGVDQNMGFYNNAGDGGSNFQFRLLHSEAYELLHAYFAGETKVDLSAGDNAFPAAYVHETAIGYYPAAPAKAYETAYAAAADLLQVNNADDADYNQAREDLTVANEALKANAPEAGACYALRSAAIGQESNGKLAYAEQEIGDASKNCYRMLYDKNTTAMQPTDARAVWQFTDNGDGTYKMKNLHAGMYAAQGTPFRVQTNGENVVFKPLGEGQTLLKVGGTSMSTFTNYGTIRQKGDDVKNSNSAWLIEKVDTPEDIFQSVNVSAYEYAGFYSAYPVSIPEGLSAYYIKEGDADGAAGKAMLTEITDIIPANTGVILCGSEGSYEMHYTAEATEAVTDNLLQGSPVVVYKQGEADMSYYLFGVKNGEVGLYQAWLQYSANGTIADGNANTDNGGYFKVSANKIFMPYAAGGNVTGFLFDFNTATAIEGIESNLPADAPVHDLSGRRITRITQPGLYIVGGRKRIIK